MTISQTQKIDLLFKKAFGVTKTDLETNKSASNESITSPLIVPAGSIWTQSDSIPTGGAAAVSGIVEQYVGASAIECVPDITTVQVGGVYPTWKTNLTDWVPTQFHPSYMVKVYVDDPGSSNPSSGIQLFAAGSNDSGEYYFDYSAGVLNFIGGTIPPALTSSKKLYVTGFRYIGTKGIPAASSANCIGYQHLQSSASDIWTIEHNRNSMKVVASIYDENWEQIIPDQVKVINNNTVSVNFSTAIAGSAMIITF